MDSKDDEGLVRRQSLMVKVSVEDRVIPVSVGVGGVQTFKWLAGVVLARMKALKFIPSSKRAEALLITGIRNDKGELLNPLDTIYQHVVESCNELYLKADISYGVTTDEFGNPILSEWVTAAFVSSKAGVNWHKGIKEFQTIMGEIDDEFDENRDMLRYYLQARAVHNKGMSPDLARHFFVDWNRMQLPVDFRLYTLSTFLDPIRDNYALISRVFIHYYGGEADEDSGICFFDFAHFVHTARIFNFNNSADIIESVFMKTVNAPAQAQPSHYAGARYDHNKMKAKTATSQTLYPVLNRSKFIEALLLLTFTKLRIEKERSWQEDRRDDEAGEDTASELKLDIAHTTEAWARIPSEKEVMEAFPLVLEHSVRKVWDDISSTYVSLSADDPDLPVMNQSFFRLTKKAFIDCCSVDDKMGPSLSLQEFGRRVVLASFVTPDEKDIIKSCFLRAQLNPPLSWVLDSLCYSEFIEALARMALLIAAPPPVPESTSFPVGNTTSRIPSPRRKGVNLQQSLQEEKEREAEKEKEKERLLRVDAVQKMRVAFNMFVEMCHSAASGTKDGLPTDLTSAGVSNEENKSKTYGPLTAEDEDDIRGTGARKFKFK